MPIAQQTISDVLEHEALVSEPSLEVRFEFFDAPIQDVMGHGSHEVGVPSHSALTEAGILVLFPHRVGNRPL